MLVENLLCTREKCVLKKINNITFKKHDVVQSGYNIEEAITYFTKTNYLNFTTLQGRCLGEQTMTTSSCCLFWLIHFTAAWFRNWPKLCAMSRRIKIKWWWWVRYLLEILIHEVQEKLWQLSWGEQALKSTKNMSKNWYKRRGVFIVLSAFLVLFMSKCWLQGRCASSNPMQFFWWFRSFLVH